MLNLYIILFLFYFDELPDASMRKESMVLLQTAMARHVTSKTAYLKPETNGILTENHFNICTSHPICMKLTKFDKIWHEMEAHEEMFNNLEYLQHIICHFGLCYKFFWLKHLSIDIFLFICCQNLELLIAIKDRIFGCNIYLFCLKIKFKVVDFKKLDY